MSLLRPAESTFETVRSNGAKGRPQGREPISCQSASRPPFRPTHQNRGSVSRNIGPSLRQRLILLANRPRGRMAITAIRSVSRNGLGHHVRMLADHPRTGDREIRRGGAGLFPVSERADGNAEAAGELGLRQAEGCPGPADEGGRAGPCPALRSSHRNLRCLPDQQTA